MTFTYTESPLPKGEESQSADVPNLEQLSPTGKKPSLPDIKPKIEWSPKKEPQDVKIEAKKEVVEDVQLKQEFSDVEKGDLMEQLVLDKKDMISQLREQIAEKDQQIAEQIKQIAKKDEQIMKYQQIYERLPQG